MACALIGIVALQVSMLRLNSQIGRSVARESVLERQNAELRAGNGRLADDARVRDVAARTGLVDPGTGSIRFLRVGGADARRAAAEIKPPLLASTAAAAPITPVAPVAAVAPVTAATTPTTTTTTTPTATPAVPVQTASTAPVPATTTIPTTTPTTTTAPSVPVTGTATYTPTAPTTGGAGTP